MTTVNTEEMYTKDWKIKQKWLKFVTALLHCLWRHCIVYDVTTLFVTSQKLLSVLYEIYRGLWVVISANHSIRSQWSYYIIICKTKNKRHVDLYIFKFTIKNICIGQQNTFCIWHVSVFRDCRHHRVMNISFWEKLICQVGCLTIT